LRFLIDADVPHEVAWALRNDGHSVVFSIEALGKKAPDVQIWNYAQEIDAVTLTCNRDDFLELAGNDPKVGLIILNRKRKRSIEAANVLSLIKKAGESGIISNINFA
jgi:predicted nuclease of predicted toxin-antitoxin system